MKKYTLLDVLVEYKIVFVINLFICVLAYYITPKNLFLFSPFLNVLIFIFVHFKRATKYAPIYTKYLEENESQIIKNHHLKVNGITVASADNFTETEIETLLNSIVRREFIFFYNEKRIVPYSFLIILLNFEILDFILKKCH